MTYKHIPLETINGVIEYLRGSCHLTEQAADMFNIDDNEVLEIIAETGEIDNCSTCNWWCDMSELSDVNGELVCEDCKKSSDDEESE